MAVTSAVTFDPDKSLTPALSSDADATRLASGGFVVVGTVGGQVGGVIYNPLGVAVASFTGQPGANASVVQLTGGMIAVVSESAGTVFVRYYNENGVEDIAHRAIPFSNPGLTGIDVTALQNGNFAVSYQFELPADSDVQYDIWDASGTRLETVVVDSSTANDRNVSIATLDNGNVVLAWTRTEGNGDTAVFYAIRDENGDLIKGPTLAFDAQTVNRNPSVIAINGGFAIAHETDFQFSGSIDIFLSTYASNGDVTGGQFLTNRNFNQTGEGDGTLNSDPYFARAADGNVAVTYTKELAGNKDQIVTLLAQPDLGRAIDFPHLGDHQIDPVVTFFGAGQLAAFHSNLASGSLKGDHFHGFRDAAGDEANDTINGDDFIDLLNGGGGDDTLNGGRNADTLLGGDGQDTLHGADGDDVIRGDGNDGFSDLADFLFGEDGNDILGGDDGNDTLNGGAGLDSLDGGTGADTLIGGAGSDTYILDNAGDIVDESIAGSSGTDTINATITVNLTDTAHYKGNIENITLLGTANLNATGNGLANTLTGNSGANTLDGGAGADVMRGLAGNDVYGVRDATDIVDESIAGSSGTDTINATITVNLTDTAHYKGNIENVTLFGTANLNATGNALANVLIGNSGANTLDGGAGADTMRGLGGNDLYGVREITDVVDESVAGSGGIDRVNSLVSFSLVQVGNAAIGKGAIESVTLLGTADAFIYGNGFANVFIGNSGSNVLAAGAGNDTLTGAGGNDFFLFNTALNATTNVDTITDMNEAGNDTIGLENAIFTTLTTVGALAAGAFQISTTGALDADDRIIYNSTTGALIYDSNGNGAGGATQFAQLDTGLALTAADFVVV